MSKPVAPIIDHSLVAGFLGPFTAIARAMSNNFGVRIVPNGFRCATDGQTIWIPFAADHLGPDKRLHLNGMLDHEVCHVVEEREHAQAGRPTPGDLMKMTKNKTIRMLLNVVEDIRIEKKWMKVYPGVAENLQGMHAQLVEMNKDAFAKKEPKFWDAFGVAFFTKARCLSKDLSWCGKKALTALAEVEDEMGMVDSLEWVQDSYDVAERIYNKLNRDAEETLERSKKPKPEKKEKPKKKEEDEGKSPTPKGESSDEGEPSDSEGESSESDSKEAEPKPGKDKGEDEGDKADEDLDADDDEGGAGSDDDDDLDADDEDGGDESDDDSPGSDDGDEPESDDGDETDEDDASVTGDDDSDEELEDDEDDGENGKGKAAAGSDDGDEPESDDEVAGSPEGAAGDGDGYPTEEDVERAKEVLGGAAGMEDLTDILRDALERAAREDAREHHLYIPDPEMRKLDKWFKPVGGDLANYLRSKEQVNQQIGAIRAKQLAYIQTITRKKMITGQDAGILDAAALATVRTGSVDVFADIKKGIALDTSIEVLLDLSGSTGAGDTPGDAAYYTKRISIALAEAWEPLNIPNEFMGFTNNWHRGPGGIGSIFAPVPGDPDSVRRRPFDYYIFKAWGERLKVCRERFTHIRGYGDNADGEAVLASAQRLAMRKEKRKMLIVISDGLPAHGHIEYTALENHLRETVRRITRAGIEVLGVGAGTDAPKRFYNKDTGAKNLIIKDLNTMAPQLFKTLRESIMP
jgi:cobalamin biosynthesis protein CobT